MTKYERENEISADEVIKRLERCVKRGNRNYDTDIVLDLIYRQKSEIEELKIENKSLRSAANCYKLYYNEARTEAIKEFVEKLKKRYDNPVWYLGGSNGFFDNLDNFVKEMVGDTE